MVDRESKPIIVICTLQEARRAQDGVLWAHHDRCELFMRNSFVTTFHAQLFCSYFSCATHHHPADQAQLGRMTSGDSPRASTNKRQQRTSPASAAYSCGLHGRVRPTSMQSNWNQTQGSTRLQRECQTHKRLARKHSCQCTCVARKHIITEPDVR